MEDIEDDLLIAGIPVARSHRQSTAHWDAFVETVKLTLSVLQTGHP